LRAHNKGLELAFGIDSDVPFVLAGDVGRLRQVVVNLVGNAIKFTDAGEVVLNLQCASQTADRATLLVSVRDTGIGIPRDKQERIFAPFEQADTSTTRTYGGTGLGLTISSRLVEMMGGTIWVESEPKRGSTFFFTATFGVVDAESRDRRRAVVVSDTPVLIVDDNATNRRILFDMLTNWGMKPTLATGAREAFSHLRDAARRGRPFRLMLLDVHMPEVDGFELAAWIRDDRVLAGTPLLMLTSASRPGDAERRATLGVAGHLMKPVKQSELFDAMVSALGVTAAENEEEHRAAASPLRSFDGLRVLLTEDNAVNQKLAVGVLTKLGCTVTVAENGRQAVAATETQDFDMVLMDVQMPEMDGFAATDAIREREQSTHTHIPIVAMTAHAMKGDRERCLAAGMDAYVAKPLQAQELFEVIECLVRPPSGPEAERPIEILPPAKVEVELQVEARPPEPLLDRNVLLARVDGDPELLQEVVGLFLDDAPRLLSEVRAAVTRRDAPVLERTAHTLKGCVGNFGAKKVFDMARRLEEIGRGGDLSHAEAAWSELEEGMAHFHRALAALQEESVL
jgi:CheY-like chemotaxis protein/anti-sigma regulatory factor (Ser/Thr protein kinase)